MSKNVGIIRWIWRSATFVICAVCLSSVGIGQQLPKLSKSEEERLDRIKKELDFSQWRSERVERRRIIVLGFTADALVPSGVQCVSTKIQGDIPSYRIQCTKQGGGGSEQMGFNVWLCSSVDMVREGMLRRFLNVSAPMSYLRKRWAEERVTYGDMSFGAGHWMTGNALFELTDGKGNQQFAENVFDSIDRMLNTEGTVTLKWPNDTAVAVHKDGEDGSWRIRITKVPRDSQVVLSYRGVKMDVTGPYEVRAVQEAEDQDPSVNLVIIQKAQEAKSHRVVLDRDNSVGDDPLEGRAEEAPGNP